MARRKVRPLRYNKTMIVKIEAFYANKLQEMADKKGVKISTMLRRIIRAAVHVQLAREQGATGTEQRYKTK